MKQSRPRPRQPPQRRQRRLAAADWKRTKNWTWTKWWRSRELFLSDDATETSQMECPGQFSHTSHLVDLQILNLLPHAHRTPPHSVGDGCDLDCGRYGACVITDQPVTGGQSCVCEYGKTGDRCESGRTFKEYIHLLPTWPFQFAFLGYFQRKTFTFKYLKALFKRFPSSSSFQILWCRHHTFGASLRRIWLFPC